MLQIEITEQQRLELAAVLEERMGELSREIHHANVSTFRDALRARMARLKELLELMRTPS